MRHDRSTALRAAVCITGLEVGGAETVLADLLAHRPDDIEVKVITLIDGGPIADRITAMGVEVVGLHMTAGKPSLGAFFRLCGELRRYKPDVVHTWMYHADLMGGVAAKLIGTPKIIWHLHNSDLAPERTRRMTLLVVKTCARLSRWVPDRILSCSEAGARVHEALGYASDRMVVVPNGVDAERFAPSDEAGASVREEFGIDAGQPLIGLVARYDPQKNHRGFFDAVRLFFERGGQAHFLLAGRGVTPDHWQLPGWRDETGHPERITLAGHRPDVARLMAALDVATSSSLGEAFPVSLIESMACGVPCAATDVGDCRTIIADTGVVVPSDDPEALAAAWERLLAMSREARRDLGLRARQRVLDNFTIEGFADRVWGFYRD